MDGLDDVISKGIYIRRSRLARIHRLPIPNQPADSRDEETAGVRLPVGECKGVHGRCA